MGRPCQGAGPWEADALRGIHTQDEYDYFFNSLAGDFAAGEWKTRIRRNGNTAVWQICAAAARQK